MRDELLMVTLVPVAWPTTASWPRCWSQAGFKLSLFKEDELNLETAFMVLTKGITS